MSFNFVPRSHNIGYPTSYSPPETGASTPNQSNNITPESRIQALVDGLRDAQSLDESKLLLQAFWDWAEDSGNSDAASKINEGIQIDGQERTLLEFVRDDLNNKELANWLTPPHDDSSVNFDEESQLSIYSTDFTNSHSAHPPTNNGIGSGFSPPGIYEYDSNVTTILNPSLHDGYKDAKTKDMIGKMLTTGPNVQLAMLKIWGAFNHSDNQFPVDFDIDAVIRQHDGKSYRLLDIAAQTSNGILIEFLLHHGAEPQRCLPDTQNNTIVRMATYNRNTHLEIDNLANSLDNSREVPDRYMHAELDNVAERLEQTEWELAEVRRQLTIMRERERETTSTLLGVANQIRNEVNQLAIHTSVTSARPDGDTNVDNPLPSAGPVTPNVQITTNAAAAPQRSWGKCIARLCNPIRLAAVVAGGSLYAASLAFNGMISAAYIGGIGFAGMAMALSHAVDETASAGINLVWHDLIGMEKMKTRHYLTKTLGVTACVTALVGVALIANNPASIGMRALFISSSAYLGATLMHWALEKGAFFNDVKKTGSNPSDTIGSFIAEITGPHAKIEGRELTTYEKLTAYFEKSQPDMQLETWHGIRRFIYQLATERGIKQNFHTVFGEDAKYSGIKSAIARFAMRPIILQA